MQRLPYFFMFTEARNDAKLRCLSDAQHRTWFNLLCYAAEQPTRGRIDNLPKYIVVVETAGGDEARFDETIDALVRLDIVTFETAEDVTRDKGVTCVTVEFRAFQERNHRKPSDSPEATKQRKAAERARRKGVDIKQDASMSRDVTPRHAPVTPCHAIEERRLEENLKEREKDAGAKPEPKTTPTLAADDPVPVIEPIGKNTASQVSQALLAAEKCYPMRDNLVMIFVPQWLADHEARRVIAAIQAAKERVIAKPESYIPSLLADPTFPREAKPNGRPAPPPQRELKTWVPPVLDESMFDLTPEQEAALARRDALAARGKTV